MNTESNFSTPVLLNEKPKGSVLSAVLLGLLALVLTAIALFLAIKLPALFDSVAFFVGGIFGWESLGGLIAATWVVYGLVYLLGCFVAVMFSWFKYRSKKMAAITLLSAIIFQTITFSVLWWVGQRMEKEAYSEMNTENARMDALQKNVFQYGSIGDVRGESKEPFDFTYVLSGEKVKVSLFKKLVFNIPITISHAGKYTISIPRYSNESKEESNDLPISSSVTQIFDVGIHMVTLELVAGKSPDRGYELPSSVGGKASVEMRYHLSNKEILDSYSPEYKKAHPELEKEIELQNAQTQKEVIVANKEVQF